jgi:hypothetical protein
MHTQTRLQNCGKALTTFAIFFRLSVSLSVRPLVAAHLPIERNRLNLILEIYIDIYREDLNLVIMGQT